MVRFFRQRHVVIDQLVARQQKTDRFRVIGLALFVAVEKIVHRGGERQVKRALANGFAHQKRRAHFLTKKRVALPSATGQFQMLEPDVNASQHAGEDRRKADG